MNETNYDERILRQAANSYEFCSLQIRANSDACIHNSKNIRKIRIIRS